MATKIDLTKLDRDLDIMGDAAVSRQITIGQTVANSDTLVIDCLNLSWDGATFAITGSLTVSGAFVPTALQLGGMMDVNGFAIGDGTLELLKFVEIASAVNELTITNATTGNPPGLAASGDNDNVSLLIDGKGTGDVSLQSIGTGNIILGNSSQFLFGLSLPGNPAISFEGDLDTGIRNRTSNRLTLVAGAVDQFEVESFIFQAAAVNVIGWMSSTIGSTLDTQLVRGGVAGVLSLQQNNTGDPAKFQVYGTTDARNSPANYTRLALSDDGLGLITIAAETAGTGADDIDIAIMPAGTGNVGIGTASPGRKLHVGGSNMRIDSGQGYEMGNGNYMIHGNSSQYVRIRTNGSDRFTVLTNGDTMIGTSTSPTEVLQVSDAIAISETSEGNIAKLVRRTTHEAHTLAAASTSDTTTITIPSGARLLAVSFNVNVAVVDTAGDDTWSAAFLTGSTTTLATAAAAAIDTKVNLMLPDEISTGVCEIRFTANGGNFSAGIIEIVVYYEELTSLANV